MRNEVSSDFETMSNRRRNGEIEFTSFQCRASYWAAIVTTKYYLAFQLSPTMEKRDDYLDGRRDRRGLRAQTSPDTRHCHLVILMFSSVVFPSVFTSLIGITVARR